MILLWFTHEQAEILAKCCIEPNLRETIEYAIKGDVLPCEEMPRTVLLEDHGDGLRYSAMAFFNEAAADEAAERWWRRIIGDDGEDDLMKRMPVQKPGQSRQDVGTPQIFLTAAKRKLGIRDFDIDLAATAENTVTKRFYSPQQNSLVQPWKVGDGWNWLNPPFGKIEPWVKRAWEQAQLGARTAVLVPAGVGSNWWRDYVHAKAHVLLLNGRITFVGETDPYPKDLCLLLYSPEAVATYVVWKWPAQTRKQAA